MLLTLLGLRCGGRLGCMMLMGNVVVLVERDLCEREKVMLNDELLLSGLILLK